MMFLWHFTIRDVLNSYIYIPLEILQVNINIIIRNEFIIPPKTLSIYEREIE
jgi:D-alanyl-lipoteichoic acid acyltransferase DltB (MBOAT superfamily)